MPLEGCHHCVLVLNCGSLIERGLQVIFIHELLHPCKSYLLFCSALILPLYICLISAFTVCKYKLEYLYYLTLLTALFDCCFLLSLKLGKVSNKYVEEDNLLAVFPKHLS